MQYSRDLSVHGHYLHSLSPRHKAQSSHGDRLCAQMTLSLQLQGSSQPCGRRGQIKLSRQRRDRWLLPGMIWVSATSRATAPMSASNKTMSMLT